MNLRTAWVAALLCTAVLLVGCQRKRGATVVVKQDGTKEVEKKAVETNAESLESFRADAKIDTSTRLFVYHERLRSISDGRLRPAPGDGPFLATKIHRDHVDLFLLQPGAGFDRTRGSDLSREPAWIEIVAVSPSERSVERDRGGSGNVWYNPFSQTLDWRDGSELKRRERVWLLQNRLLVSANAITGPAVYVQAPRSQHELMKPKPDGAHVEKVPLDAFQKEALKKLRSGDEVVLRSDEDTMRMLGAIRARTECLSCHDGGVGALLGAFSYTLTPQSEETPKAHRLADKTGLTDQQLVAVRSIEAVGGKLIRTPGGTVTQALMTFSWNQQVATKPGTVPTRLPLRNSSLPPLLAFPELTTLDVSNSLVSDDGLKTIAELKNLRRLDLRYTWTTNERITELKRALPKCEVLTDGEVP